MNQVWTPYEDEALVKLRKTLTWPKVAEKLGKDRESCRSRYRLLEARKKRIAESPYPRYTEPLQMTGDALILTDLELPYHHAEFVNRVLELAQAWKIEQCTCAGDVLHFDSLSPFGPNWKPEKKKELPEKVESELLGILSFLPDEQQEKLVNIITNQGEGKDIASDLSEEMQIASQQMLILAQLFKQVDYLLGNHEGRFLNALKSPLMPSTLLNLLKVSGDKVWRIAPYYWSYLETDAGRYQIEHPKGAGKLEAYKLAAKFHCHIIAGHSHLWSEGRDISGNYWAIQAGHCVDEDRLPYASQRHNSRDAHALGAVIVRDGYPWLLGEWTPWERMKRL